MSAVLVTGPTVTQNPSSSCSHTIRPLWLVNFWTGQTGGRNILRTQQILKYPSCCFHEWVQRQIEIDRKTALPLQAMTNLDSGLAKNCQSMPLVYRPELKNFFFRTFRLAHLSDEADECSCVWDPELGILGIYIVNISEYLLWHDARIVRPSLVDSHWSSCWSKMRSCFCGCMLIIIVAKWIEWMVEILFSLDVCLSVCLSVRSGRVDQTQFER